MVTEIDGRQTLQPRITSLLMVPHRDLAYQYLHWAQRIHAHVQPRQDFLSFAQVIVRNAADPIAERLKSIRENPPALLIGTPQALMDALEQDEPALMLASLSTVVVDEADYLIESLPRGKDKYAFLKARRVLKRHPSPTRQLLDKIYLPYRPSFALQQTGDNRDVAPRGDRSSGSSRPQLVMASATLRAHFRDFVMREGGWFSTQRGKLIRVTGPDFGVKESMEDKAAHTLGGTSISHHALVVSKEGKVANIPGATLESDRFSPPSPDLETRPRSETASASDALYDAQAVPVGKMPGEQPSYCALLVLNKIAAPGRPAPFRIQTLEAVAEAFALHVPRVALLVVQPSSPLVQIVEELRRLGVNADGLDVVHDGTGRAYMAHERPDGYTETPVLLVATLASMRGLDMPELTHVFMLGVPQDAPVDSYLHAAGRVGRFGRSGKVISILEERELVMQENGARAWKDDGKRMGRIYRAIGVPARKLAGFD